MSVSVTDSLSPEVVSVDGLFSPILLDSRLIVSSFGISVLIRMSLLRVLLASVTSTVFVTGDSSTGDKRL